MAVVIKKYSNRRLYDTDESRYITLDELTDKIRTGTDVRVVDAKSDDDLTQATLTQVILETSAAKLLPVPVLMRLIRMKDDALAEFFGQYEAITLDMDLQAKQGAQAIRPYFPLASVPFSAGETLARMLGGLNPWAAQQAPPPRAQEHAHAHAHDHEHEHDHDRDRDRGGERRDSDVEALRKELEALKSELRGGKSKPKGKPKPKPKPKRKSPTK
ncbi:MAG TPA: polyhydroxyalkanoate synthesis regulator DNA-binding domain-containing protein [Polyangiaceae bacterium]|nr:polyhydroxyalkanoate synthesis regulator DNA-binding domain-containing protein [Polyangiaceae bacterium]